MTKTQDAGGAPFGSTMRLDEGELADPVNGDDHVELALCRLNLGNVDMKEADRVALERGLGRLLTFDLRADC